MPGGELDSPTGSIGVFSKARWKVVPYGREKDFIQKYVLKGGHGARYHVSAVFERGPHIFVIENVHGELIVVDPQNPERDVSGYLDELIGGNASILRVDRLSFSNLIKLCIG